jgi:hypothetical protein
MLNEVGPMAVKTKRIPMTASAVAESLLHNLEK